jgi:hypothetical protein
MMSVLMAGFAFCGIAVGLNIIWDLHAVHDSLIAFGLGLAYGTFVPMRDHWKARQPTAEQ